MAKRKERTADVYNIEKVKVRKEKSLMTIMVLTR